MALNLTLKNVLDGLKARPNYPYWMRIEKGKHIGYRKVSSAVGYWLARRRIDDPKARGAASYEHKPLGQANRVFGYTEAKQVADGWFRARDGGIANGEATVKMACEQYVKDRRAEKGEATAKDAEVRFKRSVYEKPIGSVRLDKLTTGKLKEWRNALPGGKSTQDREFRSLKAALNLSVLNRLVGAERAIEWKAMKPLKKADGRRDLYLDLQQRRALIAAATGAVRDLIEAAALTGARPGELVKLQVGDYEARTKTITFRKGKTGGRAVPVSDAAAALFKKLSKDKLPTAHMLTMEDGEPWKYSTWWAEEIRGAAERARLAKGEKLPSGIVLYTLRHSWITEALRGGMATLDVARLSGTSLQMIQTHYGHLVADSARERLAQVTML